MSQRLQHKIAFITGACSGIGLATTERFIEEGARVLAADIQDDAGAALEARFAGRLKYAHCDVAQPAQIQAAIERAVAGFGGLDIVFNNAGAGGQRGGMEEMTVEGWDATMHLLLRAVMCGTLYALPHLKARGGGAIVNTASINGFTGNARQPAYVATKHGVIGLTRHGALKWARSHIRVNAVCPGVIETPMTGHLANDPELRKLMEGMTPMGRMGQPEEVASAVLWLCSDGASFVTGHPLVMDGGATIA